VKNLKRKIFLVLLFVLIFSGGRIGYAHEGDMKVPSTSGLNGGEHSGQSMDGTDMEGMDMSGDGHDMEGMDMSEDGHDMEGMDMEGSSHSHGPVVESPANVKVLGTFGAVNLAFILIGIWNKWFRRRGEI
jgi:hypothetical protein